MPTLKRLSEMPLTYAGVRFDAAGVYFVTRVKDNMCYEVEERNYNIDESCGLLGDCTIRLMGVKTAKF